MTTCCQKHLRENLTLGHWQVGLANHMDMIRGGKQSEGEEATEATRWRVTQLREIG